MLSYLKKLDPKIDYVGQSYAANLMYTIFIVGYSIAFLVGMIMKDLSYTLIIGIATVLISFILTVPGWPYFRRHPLKFRKATKEKEE